MDRRRLHQQRLLLFGRRGTPTAVPPPPPPVGVTFDPARLGANLALSNGNLTATGIADLTTAPLAISTVSHSTGKFYCEFTVGNYTGGSEALGFGIVPDTYDVSSAGYLDSSGGYANWIGDLGSVNGDVVGLAVDFDAGKMWARNNAGAWTGSGDPAAGTGGTTIVSATYHAAVEIDSNTEAVTANFGGSAYAFAAPAGFGNW